jgi:hypothetical protein
MMGEQIHGNRHLTPSNIRMLVGEQEPNEKIGLFHTLSIHVGVFVGVKVHFGHTFK